MVKVGDLLYGVCDCVFHSNNGDHWYFGGVIEAIGEDWVIIRNSENEPLFAEFTDWSREDISRFTVEEP